MALADQGSKIRSTTDPLPLRTISRARHLPLVSVAQNDAISASVILPAYNEAAALPSVLTSLGRALDDSYEIIVVDDGSTDGTAAVARDFGCRVIRHEQNQGKGAAVRTGIRAAQGRFVVIMDADNTYPAEAIPQMVGLSSRFDLVRGERQERGANMPVINRLGNTLFDNTLKWLSGLKGNDHLSGLYGFRRDVMDLLEFSSDGFDLEVEIGIRAKANRFRCISIPISYNERIGEKKLRPVHDGLLILTRILSLTPMYNPGLTFVLPGILLWVLAGTLAFALRQGPLVTPYGGLSVHSFIVAAVGATMGFQLVVFGIAAALYGMQRGMAPSSWMLFIGRRSTRFGAAAIGGVTLLAGVLMLAANLAAWVVSGRGALDDIQGVVLGSVLLSWGIEVVLASLFTSLFAGQVSA